MNPKVFFRHGIHASLLYLERRLNQRAQMDEELQCIHSCRAQNRVLTFLGKFPYYPQMEKNNDKPEQLTDAEFITSINQYFWLVVITSSNTDVPIKKPTAIFSMASSCIIKNHWSLPRILPWNHIRQPTIADIQVTKKFRKNLNMSDHNGTTKVKTVIINLTTGELYPGSASVYVHSY